MAKATCRKCNKKTQAPTFTGKIAWVVPPGSPKNAKPRPVMMAAPATTDPEPTEPDTPST